MDFLSETEVAQGMVLASLIGGFALAAIAQLVSVFPRSSEASERTTVDAAVTRLALAATLMMINVWSGIIFFLDDGSDRQTIAIIFYAGLFFGVLLFAVGMAETVAVASPLLRLSILWMFGALLIVEVILALAFLR